MKINWDAAKFSAIATFISLALGALCALVFEPHDYTRSMLLATLGGLVVHSYNYYAAEHK